ncbi:MAG: bifunctional (p)ppGpp synthetase/guanosine-3',5'-bis(diphosphate) 3'-pyrophosphohydrolase [Ignavibacteriae bacterium]|nr:bifunctional (p)ppGpp synthetase/guanosine-3',5'-bis(diphosphate) 3'-pyrophosphohydrolase [Ignavibacteria bacterium]MBI3365619.1 bifunctional (p)ppGpp synthetase/guanosine-3',5'-bis(diphosphate) 3'-pyrophosphohydrolase [Ignavibacteriota bacterium]
MKNGIYKKKLDDLLVICRKNLRTVNEDLIRKAFEFSVEAHKNDIRASGDPFFNHPYEVAMVVAKEIPLDDVSVASALLHDVAEDTVFTIKDIRQEFGSTIADIVDGATKISDIFKSHEVTQAESYRKLLLSMVNDIRVILLKFADRLHNMRTLEYLPKERQLRMAKETLDIYAPFAHRFGLAKIKWELEDLAFKYLHPQEYEQIAHKLKSRRKERESYIRKFVQPVEKRLHDEGMTFEIEGRPKHFFSIYNKMVNRNKPFDEVYDLFAVRIVLDTENINDCFTVYGILSSIYIPIPERFKNYISVPKKNGYQSIHATVVGPEGKMVEVQIRTRGMHEIAEKGVAAHWKYKENLSTLDEELENWISWVREIFEHADEEAVDKQLLESFKLNLYQDEIYVFTPKGELKILPQGATPVDFAFAVHSNIGFHCLSAKVNGRIVSLDTPVRSGDQVEIITSKHQMPKADWEQFVVTHKAKSQIRKWIKEEERKAIANGRELWEKKLKKAKLHINDDDLMKYVHEFKVGDLRDFFLKIQREEINPDAVVQEIELKMKHPRQEAVVDEQNDGIFNRFISTARNLTSGITLFGTRDNFLHSFAKCCNPIPGDEIVGYVTKGEGVKVHLKLCKNLQSLMASDPSRIVDVGWPVTNGVEYASAVRISGEDRTGMLNDITHSISTYQNTNIRGVKIDAKDSLFEGTIMLGVKNTEHLDRIIEKLRKIKGVFRAERLVE